MGAMNVLVMGGTRFNGLAVVHELVAQGHQVTVCNRGRTESDIPDSVERLIADRTDHDRLREVLGGRQWDCVHDLTAYHPEDVEIMHEILRDLCGHYVFASSTVTYCSKNAAINESDPDDRGETQIEYGLHKLLCEDIIFAAHADHAFPASSVAFSMVVGPGNPMTDREPRMFRRILAGRPVLLPGDGATQLQLGDVGDQANALVAMMGKPITFGKRYNLTGAEVLTRNDYVSLIGEITGVHPDVRPVPAELMEALWTGQRLVEFAAGSGTLDVRSSNKARSEATAGPRALLRSRFLLGLNLVPHLAPNLHWWNQDTTFNIERLATDIGWRPRHTAASMLDRAFAWWQNSGGVDHPYDWSTEDQILAQVAQF